MTWVDSAPPVRKMLHGGACPSLEGWHDEATHFLEESTVDGLGRTTDTEYDGQVDASALVRVFAARANGPRPHWSVLGADTVPATRS